MKKNFPSDAPETASAGAPQLGYEAWLHWRLTLSCNLSCPYCLTRRETQYPFPFHFLRKKLPAPKKIDIPALMATLEKASRTFLISFTGGEPFLVPNFVEACVAITRRHHVGVNTNLTLSAVRDFAERISPQKVAWFVASPHFKELERRGLTGRYLENFQFCRTKGFNVETNAVAHPELLPELEKYRQLYAGAGIDLKFSPFFGPCQRKRYPAAYTENELNAFGLSGKTSSAAGRDARCNAGYNAGVVNENGDCFVCFDRPQKMGNIYQAVAFRKNLISCSREFCACHLSQVNYWLYQAALTACHGQTGDKRSLRPCG